MITINISLPWASDHFFPRPFNYFLWWLSQCILFLLLHHSGCWISSSSHSSSIRWWSWSLHFKIRSWCLWYLIFIKQLVPTSDIIIILWHLLFFFVFSNEIIILLFISIVLIISIARFHPLLHTSMLCIIRCDSHIENVLFFHFSWVFHNYYYWFNLFYFYKY